ncbi:MAG TPA: cytochrome C [Bacteroidetes bacterium]|nr:cytochrome C [Bacteroidota bacterium]
MKKRTRNIALAAVGIFAVMQLFPIEQTNPPSDPADDFITVENPPEEIAGLMKNACYDCHSHHTEYPWYAGLQPVGWFMKNHFEEARGELNFSKWRQYNDEDKTHALEHMAEEVEETKMPLMSYWIMHPEAKLSGDKRQKLVDYFKSKIK